jgi:hypothetical protein
VAYLRTLTVAQIAEPLYARIFAGIQRTTKLGYVYFTGIFVGGTEEN